MVEVALHDTQEPPLPRKPSSSSTAEGNTDGGSSVLARDGRILAHGTPTDSKYTSGTCYKNICYGVEEK